RCPSVGLVRGDWPPVYSRRLRSDASEGHDVRPYRSVRGARLCRTSRREDMARLSQPRIGVNADFIPAGKTTGAYARLNVGYFDTIAAAGGLPIILPPLAKEPAVD